MYHAEDLTPITNPPVNLAEAKLHLRVTHDDEDSLISWLIEAGIRYAEQFQRRYYAARQVLLRHEHLPLMWLIPYGGVNSIEEVSINGSPVDYTWRSGGGSPWVHTPEVPGEYRQAEIVMDVGKDTIPAETRQAVLLLVGHWYEHREAVSEGRLVEPPYAVRALLEMGRVYVA